MVVTKKLNCSFSHPSLQCLSFCAPLPHFTLVYTEVHGDRPTEEADSLIALRKIHSSPPSSLASGSLAARALPPFHPESGALGSSEMRLCVLLRWEGATSRGEYQTLRRSLLPAALLWFH